MDEAQARVVVVRCRFGIFEFDGETLELTKHGRPVSLRPQPLKILALLLSRPGETVLRDELQRTLWGGDTFVDFEQGVNHAIRDLRAALSDTAESPRFIQTLPRRGYRFIAPVERITPLEETPKPVAVPAVAVPETAVSPPPSAAAVRSDMTAWKWAAASIAVSATLAIAYFQPTRGEAPMSPTALAVRPFIAPPADSALAVGLANAIVARLGGQQSALVRLDRDTKDADANATHALEGEIAVADGEVTVFARLQDIHRHDTVWSDSIRVRADEMFSLEDVIADRVVTALRLRLAGAEQDRLRRRYTTNNAAYAEYLRGRAALVKYTPEATRAAIQAFENALAQDSAYALARAGLAMACADMYLRFASPDEVERWGIQAEREARAALDLDADLAEAHLARAAVARKREFDWAGTMAAGRRALALNPNLDQAHFFMAAAYYHNGYMQEALIEMVKGRSGQGNDLIEPVRIEGLVALFSANFAPAVAHLEEVSRASSQAIGDTYLALAYYYSGNIQRARTMLQSLAGSRSASTAARAGAALAAVLAAQGESAAARSELDRVLRLDYRDHHVTYSIGAADAQLGDTADAYRWLRTAVDTGFACLPFFERDPLLQPLRGEPQFRELLEHVRTQRQSALSAAIQ